MSAQRNIVGTPDWNRNADLGQSANWLHYLMDTFIKEAERLEREAEANRSKARQIRKALDAIKVVREEGLG